jgi:hypothetical protein
MSGTWDRNISPVGWYVGSYLLRFIEIAQDGHDDPEKKFLTWENTVLVKATDLDHAYEKVVKIGRMHTEPYKGGITEIIPIYEEIEDGAEILWCERTQKLKDLRERIRSTAECHQYPKKP